MTQPLVVVAIWLAATISAKNVDASFDEHIKLRRKHANRAAELYTIDVDGQNHEDASEINDGRLNALWDEGTDLEFGGERFLSAERFLSSLSLSMSMPPRPPPPPSGDSPMAKPPSEDRPPTPTTPPSPTNSPAPTPSEPTSPGPTTTPGSCLDTTTREDYLLGLLSPITERSVLMDPTTPQGQAFAFILEDESTDVCQQTILQRYGLSTLYYATDGANWVESQGWVEDGVNECEWYNVTCGEGLTVAEIRLGESIACTYDCTFCTTGAHTNHSFSFHLRIKQPRRYSS